jgi:GTP-dependent dephospho-CoA kinase
VGPHQVDLWPRDRYVLPDALRGELAGAFGPVVQTEELVDRIPPGAPLAAVGDVVSRTLHDLGITPRFFVCDYQTQRGGIDPEHQRILGAWGDREVRVINPAATVTRDAWTVIRDAWHADGTTRILVDGEEDLLGIPAFLEAPDGARVLYGAPGRGIVVVTVDAAFKQRVADLVGRLEHH